MKALLSQQLGNLIGKHDFQRTDQRILELAELLHHLLLTAQLFTAIECLA